MGHSEKVKATELRKGDVIWQSMDWWTVSYVHQADRTSSVETNLASHNVVGVGMRRNFHPSEMVSRQMRHERAEWGRGRGRR